MKLFSQSTACALIAVVNVIAGSPIKVQVCVDAPVCSQVSGGPMKCRTERQCRYEEVPTSTEWLNQQFGTEWTQYQEWTQY